MNVALLFERNARKLAHLPGLAVGDGGLTLSHSELVRRSAALAGCLASAHGLVHGDRIALFMSNRCAYLEIMLAAWWGGFVPVPINAKLHPNEASEIVQDSGARLVFADRGIEQPNVIDPKSKDFARAFDADPVPLVPRGMDDLAWLFYTSGTTGKPKGAMITHRNLRAMVHAYHIDVDRIAPADSIIHAAPMSHGSGLYTLTHAAVGACQVIPKSGGYDPEEVLRIAKRFPGASLFMAPTMVRRLTRFLHENDADQSGLRTIIYGGAPLYAPDLAAAHETLGFKLAQIYGQGESPMTITSLDKAAHRDFDHPRYQARLQSAGTAQIVCDIRITGSDGLALAAGKAGEIWVRGDSVVPGYWQNPAASEETMSDGWLRTGDIGVMDDDGFLTIKDRSKDLIISGGTNIYPKEVEECLLAHPVVHEVSVIGLPDAEWGESVVAAVVLDPTVGIELNRPEVSNAICQDLDTHCLARMARFKRPKRYVFLKELPKSAYGKILKRELRASLSD